MKGKGERGKGKATKIILPLTDEDANALRAGDMVELTGTVYTARDQAHKRLVAELEAGRPLPFEPAGQTIYYAGPAPAAPGQVIGSIGPTTAGRMDAYTPQLLAAGVKAMIGKGNRSSETVAAIKRHKAVYFTATGGAAAYLSQFVIKAEVVAWPELGPEAIYKLEVKDFPAVVAIDSRGNNIFSR